MADSSPAAKTREQQKPLRMSDAIGVALSSYLWRHDPVQKAERAQAKVKTAVTKVSTSAPTSLLPIITSPAIAGTANDLSASEIKIDSQLIHVRLKAHEIRSDQKLVRTTGYSRIRLTFAENHALNLKTESDACLETKTANAVIAIAGSKFIISFRFRKVERTTSPT